MGSEHLTEGTGGSAAGDTVDVDLLISVLFTHRLLQLHLQNRLTGGYMGWVYKQTSVPQ